jgi:DNA-binding NtrC family response regulator
VVIDCTALQESLLESELFGHERGAYTGASNLKHGLFEVADSGTAVLDEVGEFSPTMQAKLLRALETGTFRRVGGTQNIEVDVRVLAATNRNLEQLVADGRFRQDLFFRLNVVSITVPPLRSRREDIPRLARFFAATCRAGGRGPMEVSDEAMNVLLSYPWPGNVRELQNGIERAGVLCKGDVIMPEDLPEPVRAGMQVWPEPGEHLFSLREAEGHYIAQVLKEVGGHRARAARILGISERQLYRKIRTYGLSAE